MASRYPDSTETPQLKRVRLVAALLKDRVEGTEFCHSLRQVKRCQQAAGILGFIDTEAQ